MKGLTRKCTRYAISWIYGEFHIMRMHHGYPVELWVSPERVHDLASLSVAMNQAAEHIDLTRGGDVAIAYEDDLHTHDLFDVPNMSKRDLEKLLARKVEKNKPFTDEASWCYHEAKHNDEEEGILLHRLPKRIVDAIVRICQDFYLTPKRLVPLTEIMSELVGGYKLDDNELVMLVAVFNERTEIVVCLGSGEVMFVRELPYAGNAIENERLLTDLDRTLNFAKQKFAKTINKFWLLGEKSDVIQSQMYGKIDAEIYVDDEALDPAFWAVQVSRLQGQISANFIPLLARKKISRNLFCRIAVWAFPVLLLASIFTTSFVEYRLARHAEIEGQMQDEIMHLQDNIAHIESLISRREDGEQKLKLLQADAGNLPALFMNHLGNLVPPGLALTHTVIENKNNEWKVLLKGDSALSMSDVVAVLTEFETVLQQPPWNITITESWENSWYEQLKSGAASREGNSGFQITGWMQ